MTPLIIIQARTGSTRLPNKMISSFFEDKTILEILLERLKTDLKDEDVEIVVATTIKDKDDAIEKICNKIGVKTFRGSEEDVLQRFIETAEKFNADKIIRICADNVFLDTKSLIVLLNYIKNTDYDYVSFKKSDGTPSILTHYGFFSEGVKLETLKHVCEHTMEQVFHEHVTNRIYLSPDIYKIKLFPIENAIPGLESHTDLRLTLDTKEDFEIQKKIYGYLINNNIPIEPQTIISYLDKINPDLYLKMAKIIKENSKS